MSVLSRQDIFKSNELTLHVQNSPSQSQSPSLSSSVSATPNKKHQTLSDTEIALIAAGAASVAFAFMLLLCCCFTFDKRRPKDYRCDVEGQAKRETSNYEYILPVDQQMEKKRKVELYLLKPGSKDGGRTKSSKRRASEKFEKKRDVKKFGVETSNKVSDQEIGLQSAKEVSEPKREIPKSRVYSLQSARSPAKTTKENPKSIKGVASSKSLLSSRISKKDRSSRASKTDKSGLESSRSVSVAESSADESSVKSANYR